MSILYSGVLDDGTHAAVGDVGDVRRVVSLENSL
jgi:hypothetical protein